MAIINVTLTDTFDDWRDKTNEIALETGDLSLLQTTIKTDIISSINEIQTRTVDIGVLADLTTSDKATAVAAINEIDAHVDTNTQNIGLNDIEIANLDQKFEDRLPAAQDAYLSIGNAGTSIDLDAITYSTFTFTCDQPTLTMTTTDFEAGREVTLYFFGASDCTITWPSGTRFPGGSEPTWSAGWDGVKLYKFGAGVYLASLIGQDYTPI